MNRKVLVSLMCLVIIAIHPVNSHSQGLFENLTSADEDSGSSTSFDLGGYVRGSAYGGSQAYDYSSVFGELSLQARLSRSKTFFYGDFRVREGLFFNERNTVLDLKEAYAGYQGSRASLYLGNQIVSWGRTDGFNPTDNITPKDYFFLTAEPNDQLMSNFMLRSKIAITNSAELDIIAIPLFRQSNYRYGLFDMGSEARFYPAVLPEKSFENASFGARLNFEYPFAGFSFSYFHGYDPFYGFRISDVQFFPFIRINYFPDFYKKNSFGADFEMPVSKTILRAEIAYDHTSDYEQRMHVPNPGLSYVLGVENSFFDVITIFQYIGKYTFHFAEIIPPTMPDTNDQESLMQYGIDMIFYESELFNRKIFGQQEEFNHAFMLSLNRFFAYETLNVELTAYYNITSEEFLVRPALSWKMTDELTAKIGASLMYGPENSLFDYSGNVLNGVFVSLKASF